MAGKIFSGVGEDNAPSIRFADDDDDRPRLIDEDDTRGLHSGPTVVDDQKVADVLKKLRSLDTPPAPLTGVTEVVVDANSSEQTRIESQPIQMDSGPTLRPSVLQALKAEPGPASLEDVMYPLKRAPSIERGSSTPTDGQPVTVAAAAQGTLFGRSIHLPEVNAPDSAEIELSSGAVHFLDGAPPTSQPFPLADKPAVVVPPPTTRPAARFHTPYDADLNTQLVPSRAKTLKRAVAFVGGLSLVGAGLWAWSQYGGQPASSNPPVAAAPAAAPAIVPLPSGSAPAPATAPPAAAAPAAPTPPPAATAKVAPPDPHPPAEAAATAPPREEASPSAPTRAPGRSHSRHSGRSADRRAASKPAPPAAEEPAAAEKPPAAEKPSHRKQAGVAEDPDATMAPSD